MDQAREFDDNGRDSKVGANGPGGLLQIAAAVKCSRAASAAARELAVLVLAEAGEDLRDGNAREMETTNQAFHRQMDALLDAANASHGFKTRLERRVHLARAMERAGVVLVDVAPLARLVEQDIARIERSAAACNTPCAAEIEACGGEHHVGVLHHLDFMEGDGGPDPLGGFLG